MSIYLYGIMITRDCQLQPTETLFFWQKAAPGVIDVISGRHAYDI
jgi:hypothetical protein